MSLIKTIQGSHTDLKFNIPKRGSLFFGRSHVENILQMCGGRFFVHDSVEISAVGYVAFLFGNGYLAAMEDFWDDHPDIGGCLLKVDVEPPIRKETWAEFTARRFPK